MIYFVLLYFVAVECNEYTRINCRLEFVAKL